MLCCGCRKENRSNFNQRIIGEGGGGVAYANYPPIQYFQPGQQTTLRRAVHYQTGPQPMQGNYGVVRQRVPEMVLQSDFRKVSGISSDMFRQIEAVEKDYDPSTANLIEAVERRGEMIVRLLDPRSLGQAGADAGRKYLSASVDGQTVQFVEIIKRPGQTLGLYIREGDGLRVGEGVFISRIAPESPVYSSGVLKVGDEVLAVNLVDVRRMSLDDVVIVMSIPRRLVLTIRSRLYRQGTSSNQGTLRRPYADEYQPPVVVVKKELDDDYGCADDLTSNRDSENGQLLHARLKGLPMNMPPVAVALEGEEALYEEAAMYYSQPPMRNTLRLVPHARDDTYVQIYQKAADARTRPFGVVTNQPQTLQRVYPRTIDNLAEHANIYSSGYTSDAPMTSRGRATPLTSRSGLHRPSSALGRQRYWDDAGTGSLRRAPHGRRMGSESGIPPTLSDDFLERYTRPMSRTSLRAGTPTGGGYGLASMHDIRQRRYDDLRASLSTHGLAGMRRRPTDGSVSDTEAAPPGSHHLKHNTLSGKYSRMSGRSSVTDALRTSSLPRQRAGSALGDYRGYGQSGRDSRTGDTPRRSQSRSQTHAITGLKFDRQTGSFGYDDDSDGAASAPELPDKPRRLMSRRGPSPSGYSSNEYRQWLTRAPSTSAIYDTVRRVGRAASTLPSGLSTTSLSKIAHSAESLLDTIRLEHQKNVLVDLYANRGVAAASAGRASPAHSMRLNRDVSSESLAARKLAHRLRGLPPQPLALDHLRATIPHPTPVRPQEDSRMNLLTLNPREFFKYRYEKPISGVAPGSRIEPSEQLQTPVSTTGTVIDSSIPQVGDGFSGIIWVHLLAGRGLRATTTTSSTTGGPSSAVSEPGVNRDLYCVIECDRVHKARTVVRNGESSFDWDEVFELDLIDSKEVSFLLYTWDPQYRHKLCYKGIVNLISLSLSETPVHSLALKMEPRGTLYIKMRYKEPSSTFQRPLPSPPLPSALFGVDVETVVVREASGSSVPLIIKRCVEEIEKRGLELVGIYRLCGSAMRKKMLRDAFEKNAWLVDLSAEHVPDINVITSLVKDYLRELPEPLFTKALFEMMVDGLSVCLPDDPAGNAKLMFSILECLPKINRCTVLYLLDHIKLISMHSERNKMTAPALAGCFGPLFSCHAECDNLHKSVEVFKFLLEIWPTRRGSVITKGVSGMDSSKDQPASHSRQPVHVPSSSASQTHHHQPQQQQLPPHSQHLPSHSIAHHVSVSSSVTTSKGHDTLPVASLTPGPSPTALATSPSGVTPMEEMHIRGAHNIPYSQHDSHSVPVSGGGKKTVAWASGTGAAGRVGHNGPSHQGQDLSQATSRSQYDSIR